ncbi:MAG TPA: hypothetical protein ENH05_03000 [Rhizobiales bacterium]|nr:hypothetical protein BMS3Bbin10_02520 [bacterium BMS3Bbin10]HDO51686.1 hypothetical protein [Hyphomicrobiales bacterium]
MSEVYGQDLVQLVEETIRTLYERGVAAVDLAPLVKLHDAVKAQNAAQGACAKPEAHAAITGGSGELSGHYDRDGRRGELEASDDVMARAGAIIDVLVQGGDTPEHAAQVITRQLLAAGIHLPISGGDARAWKRLLNWRNNLIHYKREGFAWDAYCSFKEKLAHIPPEDRLRLAIGERLWDLRNREIPAQNIA